MINPSYEQPSSDAHASDAIDLCLTGQASEAVTGRVVSYGEPQPDDALAAALHERRTESLRANLTPEERLNLRGLGAAPADQPRWNAFRHGDTRLS